MNEESNRLLTSDRLLASIVESSDDAIISKSLSGTIQSWNLAAERIFGYAAAEAVGRHISLIIPSERLPEEDMIMGRLRAGERLEHFETMRRHRDGHLFPVSLTISPIRDAAGAVIGASKIARDISDRRRAEQALREASRLKDQFLATLSHELRNPLAPIRAGVELIRMELSEESNSAMSETVAMIERQLRHMVRLLEDLLDVSRISSNKFELRRTPVEARQVIEAAVEASLPQIRAADNTLDVHLPAAPIKLFADQVRLAQVLSNLLNNAAKFSPPGARIELHAAEADGNVEISVRDQGAGISAAALPRVFEMFWQGSGNEHGKGGLGIGLALAQALTELHGGSLRAHSAGVGKGSEFTVKLPVLLGETSELLLPRKELSDGTARRILIVDDLRDAAMSLGSLLRALGHEVALSYSGIDGLLTASRFSPDVMLVDLGMPGMNGYQLCRMVRQRADGDGIFMIALTGFGQASDRAATREAGFNLHLVKPVDGQALAKLVGNLPLGTDMQRRGDRVPSSSG